MVRDSSFGGLVSHIKHHLKSGISKAIPQPSCATFDPSQVPLTDSRLPLSIDNTNLPSTDTLHPTSIDIPSRTSIDTEPRDMVAPLILVRDNNGDLHDQEGHLRNASEHRSTTPTESTASCNAVKILNHVEFAAKHPHPPSPDNVRIDRHANNNVDRHSEANIDRQPSPPIDPRAPITYRVQMPKIDVARLNALRPKPKPSENPPETVRTPSDDGEDPMEEDRIPTGRTLRRRKEKVAKHLKRGANEKEKENFQKRVFRVFRIPLHKSFEEVYYSHILWVFFRETIEKEEDIRRMFYEAREKMRKRIILKKKSDPGKFAIPRTVQGIEFPHALCDTGASVSILPRVMADHLVVKEEKLQEADFEVESLISFDGSHWCRSTPTTEHRSTYTNQDRSTGVPEYRSTTPTESIASCNAVKILTHEEFAAKHPHPPSPNNV
ncbi:hypothetical protein F2Q68_00004853 [Brassica cretica]|uniref:Uncharacterized protein n=1 Tax=Brassica cretica TaxID=69181 RepID=A0A8S9JHC3_BRACR|nr:hypothetical protein F2Q68_00004853 [Brassica cretica]